MKILMKLDNKVANKKGFTISLVIITLSSLSSLMLLVGVIVIRVIDISFISAISDRFNISVDTIVLGMLLLPGINTLLVFVYEYVFAGKHRDALSIINALTTPMVCFILAILYGNRNYDELGHSPVSLWMSSTLLASLLVRLVLTATIEHRNKSRDGKCE